MDHALDREPFSVKCPVCDTECIEEVWPGGTGVVRYCPKTSHYKRVSDWMAGKHIVTVYESDGREVKYE